MPPQVVQEPPKEIDGPYKLDPEFMRELDNLKPSYDFPKLHTVDLGFLNEPIKIPTREEAKARWEFYNYR